MPTGKGAFGPVIVVLATPDPDHQVEAPTAHDIEGGE